MQGNKIGYQQRTIKLIFRRVQFPRVFDHRQGSRHALIAAARVDNDRHFAAVHPRIGTGCRSSPRADAHVVAVGAEQRPADVCAVITAQALRRDGAIIADLLREHVAHIVQLRGFGKVINIMDIQERPPFVLPAFGRMPVQKDLSVFFNADDIRVFVDRTHKRMMLTLPHEDGYIENVIRVGGQHLDGCCRKIRAELHFCLRTHARDHFISLVRLAAQHADGSRCLQALPPLCVGNDNAFDIFDDISARLHLDAVGDFPEHIACFCGAVSDGDRLRTAHGREKLFL